MHEVIPDGEGLHDAYKVLCPRFGDPCEKEQILSQILPFIIFCPVGINFMAIFHASESENENKEP